MDTIERVTQAPVAQLMRKNIIKYKGMLIVRQNKNNSSNIKKNCNSMINNEREMH